MRKLIPLVSNSLKTPCLRPMFGSFFPKKKILNQHLQPREKIVKKHERVEQVDHRNSFEEYRLAFKETLSKIEPEAQQIIAEISKPQRNLREVAKKIEAYLQFHGHSLNQPRSIDSLVNLLHTLHMCGERSLLKYRQLIIQHLIRNEIQELVLHSQFMPSFISSFEEQKNNQFQFARSNRSLVMLMNTLNNSFDNIKFDQYLAILKIMNAEKKFANTMLRFVDKMQEKLHELFVELLEKPEKNFKEMTFLNRQFFLEYTEILNLFDPKEGKYVESLLNILLHRFSPSLMQASKPRIDILCSIYRYFPVGFKDSKGVDYKEILLQSFITFLKSKKDFTDALIYSNYGNNFLSSIITHYFFMKSQTLNRIEKDGFTYVPASEIKGAPVLPSFVWEIYEKNPSVFNTNGFIRYTIKDCYPKYYKDVASKGYYETKEPFLETQMKIRVENALDNMGIDSKKQVYISGRYVDFLLPGKIILELDGIHHFSYRSLTPSSKTTYRNLHLATIGYRVVLINIYEYNIIREIPQLQELIKAKLEVLNANNAAIVF